jgi:4-phytase/acid phosphatase
MKVWTLSASAIATAAILAASHASCSTAVTQPAISAASERTLSVTLFLRHGIRAPLAGELPAAGHPGFWPEWKVAPGYLTPAGYSNARSLGSWLGRTWRRQGLLPAGCPRASDVTIRSNNVPRTINSAQAFASGIAPTCGLAVERSPAGQVDPIFDPIGAGAVQINAGDLAHDMPRDAEAIWAPHAATIGTLRRILGCSGAVEICGMDQLPRQPISADAKGVHLDPRSRGYAGAAQGLLLQYAEGLPMPRDRGKPLDGSDIRRLSRLHAAPFIVEARSPVMAAQLSAPFLDEVRKHIAEDASGARVSVFVGHDNVLSAMTARLGIDFTADGYALNDPPLGGGFGFELVQAANGEKRVRGFYIAQSPEQLRRVSSLRGGDTPWKRYFSFRGCAAPASVGCPISEFKAILDEGRGDGPKNS